jgi:protocatechuate 3,4-dioxygenase beta subunit
MIITSPRLVESFSPNGILPRWLRRFSSRPRPIRLSQDYSADARAAEPIDYADFLVRLACRQLTAPPLALSITDHHSHLTKRVHMLLLNRQPPARRCRAIWTAGAWFTAVALLCLPASIRFAAADPAPRPNSALATDDEKKDAPDRKAQAKKQDGPKVEELAVSGQVVDKATGKPIANATVTIAHSPERAASATTETKCRTDAAGKYSVMVPSDQQMFYYQAKVEHPDYAPMFTPGGISHALIKSKPFPLATMELSAGELVTGAVNTPEGKPAPGVKVIGYSSPPMRNDGPRRLPPMFSSLALASTDQAGKFSIRMLSSKEALLWVVPEDYAPSAQVLKEKRGDVGTITLQPGVKLRGQVFDGKGKPAPGVYVNLRATDAIDPMAALAPTIYFVKRVAITNEKGEFAMLPVPPGKYWVQPKDAPAELTDVFRPRKRAELPALFVEGQVNLKPGVVPEPLEIKAMPSVVVALQFLDAQGKPMTGPLVSSQIMTSRIAGRLDGTRWNGLFKQDPDGKLTVIVPHGLENAELITMATAQGFAWRKRKEDKLHEPEVVDLSHARNIPLGNLTEDLKGFEFVQRGEALKFSGKVVSGTTGKPIEGATVTVGHCLLEDPDQKGPGRVIYPTKHKTDAEGNYSFIIPNGQSVHERQLYIELAVDHPGYASKKGLGEALSTIRKKEKAGEPLFFSKIELSPGKPENPTPKK